jgi:caa(3)-type oxidase subunit IV
MVIDQKLIYIKTTVALAILTLIEIGVSYWDLPRFNQIGLLLTLAIMKMTFVAYVFMHLYYETRLLRRILFIPIPLLVYFLLGLAYDATFDWTL